ncbi:MAG TPA: 50S ribosomal protein L11 methyltransferase, partial [Gemmatimonadales bacterium]|nr:50S ribosomal protein L11 methyltransferase [Gemmatimonadales bacterium]
MSWWAIDVRTAPERREWLGAWLVSRTGQAVEERQDGTLVTFAGEEGAADALVAEMAAALAAAGAPPPATERRRLDDVAWSTRWRDGLGPRHFGRLTVMPSWVGGSAAAAEATVVLDPENAFGSGEHGSTRAALTLLERRLRPGDRVLDLGSGSGILAIAAARLGAGRAVGIEEDPEANQVAARNAARNGVGERTDFLDGDAGDLAPLLGPADLVVSNILRTVNTLLLPAIVAALRPGGVAIFSGMEQAEADRFRPLLQDAGLGIAEEVTDAGWWAVAARR